MTSFVDVNRSIAVVEFSEAADEIVVQGFQKEHSDSNVLTDRSVTGSGTISRLALASQDNVCHGHDVTDAALCISHAFEHWLKRVVDSRMVEVQSECLQFQIRVRVSKCAAWTVLVRHAVHSHQINCADALGRFNILSRCFQRFARLISQN